MMSLERAYGLYVNDRLVINPLVNASCAKRPLFRQVGLICL